MPGGDRPPFSVVQTWPTPNYVNPENHGRASVVVVVILGVIATVVVVARFWSRFFLHRNSGLDDWLFLAAMPPMIALGIGICLVTQKYGFRWHAWDVPLNSVTATRKVLFSNCICYVISTCLIKTSILCFYRRLTHRVFSTAVVYFLWACIASEFLQLISCLVALCFACRPMSAYWNQFDAEWTGIHGYTCVPQGPTLFAMAIVSVIQDFIATVLPFTLFLKLQIPKRQKIALCCTFAGGLLVCGAGIVRGGVIYHSFFQTYDITWSGYNFEIATAVEALLATIFASVPALKYYFSTLLESHSASRKASNNAKFSNFGRSRRSIATLPVASQSTSMTRTLVGSEIGEISSFTDGPNKGYAKADTMAMDEWDIDLKSWHGRSPSCQESQLRADGIIGEEGSFAYFNKDTRRMVTDDPRPCIYPWVDSDLDTPPAQGSAPEVDWLVPEGP